MSAALLEDVMAPSAVTARKLDQNESRYMEGAAQPATSSVLISNSKYLNNPLFRDIFAQFALRRHGHDLPETYLIPQMIRAVGEVQDLTEFAQLIEAEKAKKPEFGAWLARRRFTDYEPNNLRGYASGTVGAAIRDFIEVSGMEMQFMMKGETPNSDLEYMIKRRVAHHDIEHMVTGFGPNQLGEESLAIMHITAAANYFSPQLAHHVSQFNMFVSATGYYRVSLHYPALMPAQLEAMRRGIAAGQALKQPLFMMDWEDHLDRRLEDICTELGFERGPGEAWAWSLQASTG